MNTLTIDIGNTHTKYDFWADDGFLIRKEFEDTDALIESVGSLSVEGIIVSSVKENPGRLISRLNESTPCKVVCFNQAEIEKYKEKIQYKGKIGSDRIAAYLGGEALFPGLPMLVVDLGTALTIDVADDEGKYRGGNISLGFISRMKALSTATSLLPEVEKSEGYISFGDNTVRSIQSGAINGVIGEIKFAAERAKQEYNIKKTVITGGDGLRFYDLLNKETDCFYDPYLVGRGLNRHLRMYYFGYPERYNFGVSI